MFFQVLQQGAARAVHDALGHAGGAGGVHHIQRMIERQLFKDDLFCLGIDEIIPEHGAIKAADVGLRLDERCDDDGFHRVQLMGDTLNPLQAVEYLAVVTIPVGGD
eukprot:gnl/Carplike_NY0171/814_a1120_842.p4 GENE.gnl/Carplike_NY0171/814_a1120_842~~gnl/Carplike_NY0171/814_a1120_842.p4  ORF type:complete len:106 (+),score=13.94 gnl/Carplike_NY0171/814_a1120_842:749-1066(+)